MSDNKQRQKTEDDFLAHQLDEISKGNPSGGSETMQQRLLTENQWRKLVQQSNGWVHYLVFPSEPWVLLFRRPIGTDPVTGVALNNQQK